MLEGTAEEGNEYILFLTKYDNSTVYFISSKNSVYPLSDTETLNHVMEILAQNQ